MKTTKNLLAGLAIAAVARVSGAAAMAQDVLKIGSYPSNPPRESKNEAADFEGFALLSPIQI